MPALVPTYTVDDLESFPDDGNRYEILDGVLLVSPAPLPAHEVVVARIHYQLVRYLSGRAMVFTRGAVEVRPRNHLEPDLLVMPNEGKLPKRWSDVRHFWLGVEVSGKGSRVYDRDFKLPAYPRLGVAEAWRADLRDHTIEVIRPGSVLGSTTVRDQLVWRAPGFATDLLLNVPAIFEGIEDDD